tara:strand:+ start:893 stop:1567 length:675 start_codon:yes stop_codon:yes gene_type:complete
LYIIIVGVENITSELSYSLNSQGHEVFVIDNNLEKIKILQEQQGLSIGKYIDVSNKSSLVEIGIERAERLIAVSSSDAINLTVCQIAKNIMVDNSNFKCIAVVNEPKNHELFEINDIDIIANQVDLLVSYIANAIPSHPIIRLMPLPNSQELISIKIPTSGVVSDKLINDIILPYGCSIVLIIDIDGKNKLITDRTVINSGDEIILITNLNAINEVWNLLTELR